jgi:hypothetical protein
MKSDLSTFNFKPCSEMADIGTLKSPSARIKSCSLKAGRMTALAIDSLKPQTKFMTLVTADAIPSFHDTPHH